jgi:hypothetical protein
VGNIVGIGAGVLSQAGLAIRIVFVHLDVLFLELLFKI